MPPSADALRRAGITTLSRAAVAQIVAKVDGGSPERIAERMWPGDRDVGLLTRAGVAPISTTSASALMRTLTEYLIASLSGISAAAILLAKTMQLSFAGSAVISVPSFVADASGSSFVGEGMPIPARSLLAQPLLLTPSKLATISALTSEMANASGGNAEKMIGDVLMRSTGLALDAALFDANAAVAEVRPAGLRNGVAASTASAATDPTDAMIADIATLTAVVAAVAGTEPVVLIGAPARARTMPLRSVALAMDTSFIILPSSAIAPGDLIAIAPGAIVSATDSVPEISVSRESVLHMETNPQQLVSAGTPPVVAAPQQSLFQSDALALKCRLPITWGRRDPRAVSWLTATGW